MFGYILHLPVNLLLKNRSLTSILIHRLFRVLHDLLFGLASNAFPFLYREQVFEHDFGVAADAYSVYNLLPRTPLPPTA